MNGFSLVKQSTALWGDVENVRLLLDDAKTTATTVSQRNT